MSNNMFFKRRKTSFRELILKLNICLETAEEILHRARCYVKRLYVDYLAAHAMGDDFKALMYVAEISEVECMVELISEVCLTLEKAIIRLTIFSEFYDAFSIRFFKCDVEELGNISSSVLSFSLTLMDDLYCSSENLIALTTPIVDDLDEHQLNCDGLTVKNMAEGLVRHLMGNPSTAL
ncbi:hypothetical protein KEJ27_04690 [Candidatus Bathyarchaeota archaeon]|nr:hypothetical protein [Candidatus Bathyarchaeota archaeon]MBS7612848.1 hypothetical protein [Candidatus Bathyarchaeota archaeon]MBS7617692.1 hypothetical protein [Candidatus Bathyarchaeota archaeon]